MKNFTKVFRRQPLINEELHGNCMGWGNAPVMYLFIYFVSAIFYLKFVDLVMFPKFQSTNLSVNFNERQSDLGIWA